MAIHALSAHFEGFFDQLNPSESYAATAASEHLKVRRLLEDRDGPAGGLEVVTFLQGSYKQDTAIHSINDIDVVALCSELVHPGDGSSTGKSWSRNDIFATLEAALLKNQGYRDKIRYSANSLCLKLDLEIKVEILPAVKKRGTVEVDTEPFRIYRPDDGGWSDAYARDHQRLLTKKNGRCDNFKPMIKVMKHLRDVYPDFSKEDAISFHLECLLYAVPDEGFDGGPADYIPRVLRSLANFTPGQATNSGIKSPSGDKILFSEGEWSSAAYTRFHKWAALWCSKAEAARDAPGSGAAVKAWQNLLGDWFPSEA